MEQNIFDIEPEVFQWPTVEQDMLLLLERALEQEDGRFCDSAVVCGGGEEAVLRGFAVKLDEFRGRGIYRITDAGREFVKRQVPPAEW